MEEEAGDQAAVVAVDEKLDEWMMCEGQSARAVNRFMPRLAVWTCTSFLPDILSINASPNKLSASPNMLNASPTYNSTFPN